MPEIPTAGRGITMGLNSLLFREYKPECPALQPKGSHYADRSEPDICS
jgi:hypothetical protein